MSIEDESFISPTVKFLLFVSNFLFWVAGIALAIIGIWAFITKELEGSSKKLSAWSYVFDVSLIFILVGVVAFCIASAGCIGTLRENVCLLKVFCAALSFIDLVLLLVGLVSLLMWNSFVDAAKDKLSIELIRSYNDDPDLADFINYVQIEFKCCGISDKGYEDWSKNAYFNCTSSNINVQRCGVPHSCCKDSKILEKSNFNSNCGYNVRIIDSSGHIQQDGNISSRIHVTGCLSSVVQSIKDNILLFSLSAFGIGLIPMCSIYLARTLITQIQIQKSRWISNMDRLRFGNVPRYITTRT